MMSLASCCVPIPVAIRTLVDGVRWRISVPGRAIAPVAPRRAALRALIQSPAAATVHRNPFEAISMGQLPLALLVPWLGRDDTSILGGQSVTRSLERRTECRSSYKERWRSKASVPTFILSETPDRLAADWHLTPRRESQFWVWGLLAGSRAWNARVSTVMLRFACFTQHTQHIEGNLGAWIGTLPF
jgi:hypothetical protein